MKKKFAWFFCVIIAVLALSGCKSDGEASESIGEVSLPESGASAADVPTERVNLADIKVEDYVTLGEYKGIEVAVAPAAVDEDEWDELVFQEYGSHITADMGITDRAVKNGDTVNIDYVGKKDGVAFDGGTADGQLLTIGSDSYIDGFEDGLVGVKPGETVDLNLSFPDPYYSNAELSGAAVVFTVTVNFIIPEMEDAIIAGFGQEEYSNVEELRQYVYDYLYEDALYNYDTNVESILNTVVNNCTYSGFPEGMLAQYQQNVLASIENMASMYGVDGEYYTTTLYQMSLDDFAALSANMSARQVLAFQAIANLEGLTLTEEELDERIETYAADNGMDPETVRETVDREEFREYFMLDDVLAFLMENITIVDE